MFGSPSLLSIQCAEIARAELHPALGAAVLLARRVQEVNVLNALAVGRHYAANSRCLMLPLGCGSVSSRTGLKPRPFQVKASSSAPSRSRAQRLRAAIDVGRQRHGDPIALLEQIQGPVGRRRLGWNRHLDVHRLARAAQDGDRQGNRSGGERLGEDAFDLRVGPRRDGGQRGHRRAARFPRPAGCRTACR